MKRLIVLLFLLSASPPSHATGCSDAKFQTAHVDLLFCENNGYWNYADLLYYKGVTRLLDHYIDESMLGEKLGRKRVKLGIISSIFAGIVFDTHQNDDMIGLNGRGRLEPLIFLQALVYSTSSKWHPFPGDKPYHDGAVPDEFVLKELDEIFDAAGVKVDLSLVKGQQFVLLELAGLRILFEDGTLFYELDGVRLKEQVQDPMPIRVGNRYLFGSEHGLRVYEGGKLIAEKAWQRSRTPAPYILLLFGGGTHVDFYDEFGVFLIYSVQTNTFHEIHREAPQGWPEGRVAAEHDRDQVRSTLAEQVLKRIGFIYLPG